MTQKTLFKVLLLIAALASLSAPPSTLSQNPQTDGYRRQTAVGLIPIGPDGQRLSLYLTDKSGTVLSRGNVPRAGSTRNVPAITLPAMSR